MKVHTKWHIGCLDMRTLPPFDDVELYAHFLYPPTGFHTDPPPLDRAMFIGPAGDTIWDPQVQAELVCTWIQSVQERAEKAERERDVAIDAIRDAWDAAVLGTGHDPCQHCEEERERWIRENVTVEHPK